MKIIGKIILLMLLGLQISKAQSKDSEKLISLSKEKWQWMSDKK